MAIWAGIDEAGYGPRLGPLVVACAAFVLRSQPAEGDLWETLKEAVTRAGRHADGRACVDDSKRLYSPARGLKRLEEAVLAFLWAAGAAADSGAALLEALAPSGTGCLPLPPWFAAVHRLALPLSSNLAAVESRAELLRDALRRAAVGLLPLRAAVVLPEEFNRTVSLTRNKAALLFQKCGLLLQELWRYTAKEPCHVVVDRHGGRIRYRRLLRDVFPYAQCDVLAEEAGRSLYRISDAARSRQQMLVEFREDADAEVFPTALASMTAKYVRELYMEAFNLYWQERVEALRPTAGYGRDAGRFLKDIAPAIQREGIDPVRLVRRL